MWNFLKLMDFKSLKNNHNPIGTYIILKYYVENIKNRYFVSDSNTIFGDYLLYLLSEWRYLPKTSNPVLYEIKIILNTSLND